jgi:hypothetical protein
VSVGTSGADGVDLSGGGTGTVSIGAAIASSGARSVNVSGRTGGTTTFSGAISGPGVNLSANTGATISFTGALTLSTTSQPTFSATGGGTVTATSTASTLASTTGTALDVSGVTIGASGLKFASISSNGAVNGIRLNNTGTSGGLSVLGGGNTTQGGNASGGTIANSTGAGVLLTSTSSVSLNNLTVNSTPNAPGIDGTGVAGFSFTNGTVTGSGTVSKGSLDSNIAFNDDGVANVTGAVTVSNSVLSNAYRHGVDVRNSAGTVSALTVSNNNVVSPTAVANTAGSGIVVQARGTATTAATITGGSITGNSVTNFPGGGGIVVSGGNNTGASAPSAMVGTDTGTPINIENNLVQGQSLAAPMIGNGIAVSLVGKGSGFVNVRNNGTAVQPLRFVQGDGIGVNSEGSTSLTSRVENNHVSPQSQTTPQSGIDAFVDNIVLLDNSTASGATLTLYATGNTVSGTRGPGMRLEALGTGTLKSQVQNNTVQAPTDPGTYGILVRSGNLAVGGDANVCLQVVGNNTSGTADPFGNAFAGIGLRKQGDVATTNDFGIVGLSPSPATAAQTSTYVASANPGSVGGAQVISGSNFVSCPALVN